ncbi:hypothetical protein D3C74_439750 [compost metagenome]
MRDRFKDAGVLGEPVSCLSESAFVANVEFSANFGEEEIDELVRTGEHPRIEVDDSKSRLGLELFAHQVDE